MVTTRPQGRDTESGLQVVRASPPKKSGHVADAGTALGIVRLWGGTKGGADGELRNLSGISGPQAKLSWDLPKQATG